MKRLWNRLIRALLLEETRIISNGDEIVITVRVDDEATPVLKTMQERFAAMAEQVNTVNNTRPRTHTNREGEADG